MYITNVQIKCYVSAMHLVTFVHLTLKFHSFFILAVLYRKEETSRNEGTARVEGSCSTGIQVRSVIRLQHTQEIGTVQLGI